MGERIEKASPAALDILEGLMCKEQRGRLGTHWVMTSSGSAVSAASAGLEAASSPDSDSGAAEPARRARRATTAHTGAAGSHQIRDHPFFGGLDWDLVLARGALRSDLFFSLFFPPSKH